MCRQAGLAFLAPEGSMKPTMRSFLLAVLLLGGVTATATAPSAQPGMLLGVFPGDDWNDTLRIISNPSLPSVKAIDSWTGKKTSIVLIFRSLSDGPDTNAWDAIWNNGYVPYMSLGVPGTADEIANTTGVNNSIGALADAVKNWAATGNNKYLYIAPLQEMNGYWKNFGPCVWDSNNNCTGVVVTDHQKNIKRAFKKFQDIFDASQRSAYRRAVGLRSQ